MSEGAELGAMPTVGIVVVNYFGGDMTIRCLESLDHLTWPSDRLAVALVDNGSEPGFVDQVRERWPLTRVVETGGNLGFGGACNRGFAVLDDCEYLGLLNNDAIPDAGWLEPLVDTLKTDPRLGAATPKVLLEGAFVATEIRSDTRRGSGADGRRLGVQLCGARIGGEDITERLILVSGFWGWEEDLVTVGGQFAWTSGEAMALLPLPMEKATEMPTASLISLRLACGTGPTTAALITQRVGCRRVLVDTAPSWYEIGRADDCHYIINNVGTSLVGDAYVEDRGYLEVDIGQYDEPAEVFGWSGAAVLLARTYLEDVGLFDDAFFLYYEDADLSWRGRTRGWRYRAVPSSIVRHTHSATVGARSSLAAHLVQRNRLVALTKNAPLKVAAGAFASELRLLATAVAVDLAFTTARGRRPTTQHVVARARILVGALRLVPQALRSRRRMPGGSVP